MRRGPPSAPVSRGSISFNRRLPFWLGIGAVSMGVVLHLPMFFEARHMGYELAGMEMGAEMYTGMALIVVGLALTAWGLIPLRSQPAQHKSPAPQIRALDDAPLRIAHVGLLLVMAAAVTIDVMKPVALGFVAPGMAEEYGLKAPNNLDGHRPVALLPLAGIVGTVLGSFIWGALADRIGRRASILLAAVLFIATAICGSMPSFNWNLVMCFLMGLGAGGMLPITFALLAETIPARHRGWLMLLIGGDVAGAYIITSWLAAELTPTFGWRILWLIGLPTGLLLIVLNRWIPESPRFLHQKGRAEEARAVMKRYGVAIVPRHDTLSADQHSYGRWRSLIGGRLRGLTLLVMLYGLAVGVVTFGFQLWIPSNLQAQGLTEVTSDRILRDAAIIGFPITIVVAGLYGFWSSRGTLVLLGGLIAVALGTVAVAGDGLITNRPLLYAVLAIPIVGISSLSAAIIAYSAEVYPTSIRSRGTGLAAGATKAGGVVIIALVAAAVSPPSLQGTAVIGAVPMGVAALALALAGVETSRRTLEDITSERHATALPTRSAGDVVNIK